MRCPQCDSTDFVQARHTVSLRPGWWLWPVLARKSGKVVVCARCATQLLARKDGISRLRPATQASPSLQDSDSEPRPSIHPRPDADQAWSRQQRLAAKLPG